MIHDVLDRIKVLVENKDVQYKYDMSQSDGKTQIVIEIYEGEAPWQTNSSSLITSSR